MRSCFRKGVKNILFNQKKVGEEEVSWTESMPPVTHFAWRFASFVFFSRVPMERGCHAQDERHNLEAAGCSRILEQDACSKGAFTELWRLQRSLYRAVETSKDPVQSCGGHESSCLCYSPCTPQHLPKFPRTGFLVSLRENSQSSPSPHSGYFLPPLICSGSASTFFSSFSPVPSHHNPKTTAYMPRVCNTLVPPGPCATSSLFQGQELTPQGIPQWCG